LMKSQGTLLIDFNSVNSSTVIERIGLIVT
jgi:hypothetical protein